MKKQLLRILLPSLMLLPFYVHAEEASSTITNPVKDTKEIVVTSTSSTPEGPAPSDFTLCSQEAIELRDTSIASSRSIYNIAMANALKERKNKEKAAVAITNQDEKKDAIKVSVNTYKNAVKNAQNNLTQARKAAWAAFENDIKKCHEMEEVSKSEEEGVPTGSTTPTTKKIEEGEPKNIFETIRSLFN